MTASFVRGALATAIPASVVTYDPVRQTVTAKPTISARIQDPNTGAIVPFPLPTVGNVPVAFPSATGFAITWPLAPGDTVFLVLSDRSLDEWKSTGAAENFPAHPRRFDLTDAVAIPGIRPFTKPIPPTGWDPAAMVLEGVQIKLGSSAAAAPLALQPALLIELCRIAAAIAALGGLYTPGVAPAPVPPADPALCASVKVRAE
jgi:protein gp138